MIQSKGQEQLVTDLVVRLLCRPIKVTSYHDTFPLKVKRYQIIAQRSSVIQSTNKQLKMSISCERSEHYCSVSVFPPGPPCCCWPPSWLKPTRPPDMSPGPPGQPELRARTASAPTSDGWRSTCPPSVCREPTSTSSPHLTSSTRP